MFLASTCDEINNDDNNNSWNYGLLTDFMAVEKDQFLLQVQSDKLKFKCRRIRGAKIEEEKLSALHILKNLTDEPANLIPMTNTPTCFDTLMHVAHASDDSVTEMMQYLECNALATLSHWFYSIATSGQRIATMNNHENENPTTKKYELLFVPTLQVLAVKLGTMAIGCYVAR